MIYKNVIFIHPSSCWLCTTPKIEIDLVYQVQFNEGTFWESAVWVHP